MNPVKQWPIILSSLEKEILPPTVKTWFYKTELLGDEAGNFEILFPNVFALERVNRHYLESLKKVLREFRGGTDFNLGLRLRQAEEKPLGPIFGEKVEDSFVKENSNQTDSLAPTLETPKIITPPVTANLKSVSFGLSPFYTFDEFVVGPGNQLAFTVAQSIAQNPGTAYNPFFIYSSTGLGKTHLMQAIGNEIIKRLPQTKVVYSSGESFTNELLEAIQHRSQHRFRDKFRNTDVLLIDDVHFVAGKETTQEELFHAFNQLYLARKQVVLSSDRPPRDIALLEERLRSRFAGGMIADIQAPDETVRAAILRNKRDKSGFNVTNEVIDFIAREVKTNIREMEGVFLQIVSSAKTKNQEVNLELAVEVLLHNELLVKKQKPTPKKIMEEVCELFNLSHKDLIGPRRKKELVIPRQVCMYLLRTLGRLSLVQTGQILGGRDHTTVIHAVNKIENEVKDEGEIFQKISYLNLKICG
ncbi:MAG: chromosomal replication initiator protein DnaA [Patescibacteria group bacterium]|nr:chromosomal replication initiator protein DnaA [Patescibacteria group bacterium]